VGEEEPCLGRGACLLEKGACHPAVGPRKKVPEKEKDSISFGALRGRLRVSHPPVVKGEEALTGKEACPACIEHYSSPRERKEGNALARKVQGPAEKGKKLSRPD